MEFEVDQARFLAALALVQTVAERRSTMPILGNVLLYAEDDSVSCSATDLVVSVRETVDARVRKKGSATLSVRHLHNVVRTLPAAPLVVRGLENHWAEIVCGKSRLKLMGLAEGDFPDLPSTKGVKFTTVPAKALQDLVQYTAFSVSSDETRPNLNGAFFECDGKKATMVSTDGHRLTKLTVPFAGPKLAKGVVIPRKGLLEAKRVLERADEDVELAVTDSHMFLQFGALGLAIKLNNVVFPPYKQVIPTAHQRVARVDRAVLLPALRQAEVLAPEKTATVRLELDGGTLQLTADNPDLGVSHQELDVEYEGARLVAGFNARYLLEVVEAMSSERVILEFQGELDPCVVRPAEGADYLGVVMPMRI
jgi:DNA polymerase-3 subunit beta